MIGHMSASLMRIQEIALVLYLKDWNLYLLFEILGIDDDSSIKLYGLTDEGKEVMDGFVKIFIDQK